MTTCSAAETCCDAACVDLQTDAANCGACGAACGNGLTCQGGICGVACGSDFCPAASEICVDNACETCDVTCTGSATACGDDVRDALANVSLATVHVCAGTYAGGFSIARDVTVIGAGEGADPASSTIFDGGGTQIVLLLTDGAVALRQVRVTRGEAGEDGGGGISSSASSLTMHDCTVIGNRGRLGGGIGQVTGPLTMTRCTVRDNVAPDTDTLAASGGGLRLAANATLTDCQIEDNTTAGSGGGLNIQPNRSLTLAGTTRIAGNTAAQGGGLMVNPFAAVTIGENCRVTGNTASAGNGGGIYNFGTVTLQGAANPSLIVVDNCEENCVGGVPNCQTGGTCPAP